MFVAMNRFKVNLGKEAEFIYVWKNRESSLDSVPGFKQFKLLQGPNGEDHALFISHSIWESSQAFEDWTKSEDFRKAHANAGRTQGIYLGAPQFEGFDEIVFDHVD